MVAIDAGAEDVALDGDVFEIVTGPDRLGRCARRARGRGRGDRVGRAGDAADDAHARRGGPTLRTLMRLIEALEEHDDVQARARELRRGRRRAGARGRGLSPARHGAALFWIVAGTLHFVIPRQYQAIVPPYLERWKRELVIASGVAELAGGVAVLPERPGAAPAGGCWPRWWPVYPANIHMAVNAKDFPKVPEPALWARLPVQGLFAWLTWRGTK